MDKLRAMRAFVRIVDEGSLTAAARSLDTSLPSVVRTLASLEEAIGLRLLNRTTRRLCLTEEGRVYLSTCRHVLGALEDVEHSLTAQGLEPKGVLTITAPVLFGQLFVGPSVARFVRRYEEVQCSMIFVDRIVNLLEEHIDVGIRIDHMDDSSLVAQRIGSTRRVVVASPAFLKKAKKPSHPRELVKAACVRAGRPWFFQEKGRPFTVPISGHLDFNQAAAAIQACVDGMGFGMFLSYQVASLVEDKRLRIVLSEYETPALPLNIVYPSARLLPLRTRVFIDWMKKEFSGKFGP